MNQITTQFLLKQQEKRSKTRPRLGQMLVDAGEVSVQDLLTALSLHKKLGVPLGRILVAEGFLEETRLYNVLARQWQVPRALISNAAQPDLADTVGRELCLEHCVFPVGMTDGVLELAANSPEGFEAAEISLQDRFGMIMMSAASSWEIHQAINLCFPDELARDAALRVPRVFSCRGLAECSNERHVCAVGLTIVFFAVLIAFPQQTIVALTLIAIMLSLASAVLKGAALFATSSNRGQNTQESQDFPLHPSVSIMVPLHREPDIAKALVNRLSKLTYPKALLEVLLVVEENDGETSNSLSHAELPPWMRILIVPEGHPKTKPRALNHAMRFCHGDLIGIYDAEDAPDPDQIETVVEKFRTSPRNTGCVQGILQFYNPTQNWLARCFTMDYAAWFRVILPGIARLGLPVPLGGTTLFLKREALEKLVGWDAHNVTEDADLGLRLHRLGYRTELVQSVTGEEANCRPWLWIRQRSRWIKGYMVTYWAHMRQPLQFFRDVGVRGFLGVQILFLGTILHCITAPLLWSFWLAYLGMPHPYFATMPNWFLWAVGGSFLASEILGMLIIAKALLKAKRAFLIPWIPTMSIYFLLAVPAGIKATWEFVTAPVYWDKTDHGHSLPADQC